MSDKFKSIRSLASKSSAIFKPQQTSRVITPPSTSGPPDDDPNVTPPGLIRDAELGPSPNDPLLGTPSADISLPSAVPKGFSSSIDVPNKNTVTPPHQWYLHTGVTGCDATAPLFDGSSTNLEDHLIELDNDSMETAPDVRVYFWSIGHDIIHEREGELPLYTEELRAYEAELVGSGRTQKEIEDAKLVRAGRLFIKDSRAKGIGYYVDKERLLKVNLTERCPPGSQWFRMPAMALVEDCSEGRFEGTQTEGVLSPLNDEYACDPTNETGFPLTNCRAPMWWISALKEGVVPGTNGFEAPIVMAYWRCHPVEVAWSGEEDQCRIHFRLCNQAYNAPDHYLDPELCNNYLLEHYPRNYQESDEEDYEMGPRPDLLEIQGKTARDFLMLPPLTDKEKKQRAKREKKKAQKERKRQAKMDK